MINLGYDVDNESHYVRAIDTRDEELNKFAFPTSNALEEFQSARDGGLGIAAKDKN